MRPAAAARPVKLCYRVPGAWHGEAVTELVPDPPGKEAWAAGWRPETPTPSGEVLNLFLMWDQSSAAEVNRGSNLGHGGRGAAPSTVRLLPPRRTVTPGSSPPAPGSPLCLGCVHSPSPEGLQTPLLSHPCDP